MTRTSYLLVVLIAGMLAGCNEGVKFDHPWTVHDMSAFLKTAHITGVRVEWYHRVSEEAMAEGKYDESDDEIWQESENLDEKVSPQLSRFLQALAEFSESVYSDDPSCSSTGPGWNRFGQIAILTNSVELDLHIVQEGFVIGRNCYASGVFQNEVAREIILQKVRERGAKNLVNSPNSYWNSAGNLRTPSGTNLNIEKLVCRNESQGATYCAYARDEFMDEPPVHEAFIKAVRTGDTMEVVYAERCGNNRDVFSARLPISTIPWTQTLSMKGQVKNQAAEKRRPGSDAAESIRLYLRCGSTITDPKEEKELVELVNRRIEEYRSPN